MRTYLIDKLFEIKAKNEQSARNKAEKKLHAALTTITDITDEIEKENEDNESHPSDIGDR